MSPVDCVAHAAQTSRRLHKQDPGSLAGGRRGRCASCGATADYLISLKGNQETAHEEIRSFIEDAVVNTPEKLDYFESVEKGHGRIETRRCWQSNQLDWFADRTKWRKLQSVCMIESIREIKGKASSERRFFLSSLPLNATKAARTARSHWGIENKLRWALRLRFSSGTQESRKVQ